MAGPSPAMTNGPGSLAVRSACRSQQGIDGIAFRHRIVDLAEAGIIHRKVGALERGADEERQRETVGGEQDAGQDRAH